MPLYTDEFFYLDKMQPSEPTLYMFQNEKVIQFYEEIKYDWNIDGRIMRTTINYKERKTHFVVFPSKHARF